VHKFLSAHRTTLNFTLIGIWVWISGCCSVVCVSCVGVVTGSRCGGGMVDLTLAKVMVVNVCREGDRDQGRAERFHELGHYVV
jgi:hypothetical protein